MKRTFTLPILALLASFFGAYAQQPIQIEGTTFFVNYNNETKTAEICDYNYRIDDREFPIYMETRRMNGLPKKGTNTLEIPETVVIHGSNYTVTSIGRAAFAGYTNFSYVNIPSTVQSIGEYAFYRTSLISVEIPASVVSIGNRAFGYCEKLQSLRLPYEGLAMGEGVYNESKNISVTINDDGKPLMAEMVAETTPTPKKPVSQKPAPRPAAKTTMTPPENVDVDINIPTTTKENSETFVVIIANENYAAESKVRYALNDGRIFKEYCRNTLGIPETNIHIIEDATLNNMRREINWLGRVASVYEGDARIIVYYAGHGIPDESTGSAYLLPVDGVGSDINSGYSLKSLYDELGKMVTQNVTVFMDACFSGSQRGEGMLTASRGIAIAAREEKPTGNLVVFSATQKDETAFPYEEKGHGLFTYFLLKKLQETKGDVNYEELGTYLKKQVSRHAIVVNNKPQTPSMSASTTMNGKLKSIKLK